MQAIEHMLYEQNALLRRIANSASPEHIVKNLRENTPELFGDIVHDRVEALSLGEVVEMVAASRGKTVEDFCMPKNEIKLLDQDAINAKIAETNREVLTPRLLAQPTAK